MFDKNTIDKVWHNAIVVENFNSESIRKDACGAWIIRNQYGNRNSIYGWEIDHVYPEALGGGNDIVNLRAMQWENNVAKGDDFPSYKSKVQSKGNTNIHEEKQYIVNDELKAKLGLLYGF